MSIGKAASYLRKIIMSNFAAIHFGQAKCEEMSKNSCQKSERSKAVRKSSQDKHLEKPTDSTFKFLDCRRKPEYLEKIYTRTSRTYKLHAQRQQCYHLLHHAGCIETSQMEN